MDAQTLKTLIEHVANDDGGISISPSQRAPAGSRGMGDPNMTLIRRAATIIAPIYTTVRETLDRMLFASPCETLSTLVEITQHLKLKDLLLQFSYYQARAFGVESIMGGEASRWYVSGAIRQYAQHLIAKDPDLICHRAGEQRHCTLETMNQLCGSEAHRIITAVYDFDLYGSNGASPETMTQLVEDFAGYIALLEDTVNECLDDAEATASWLCISPFAQHDRSLIGDSIFLPHITGTA